MKSTSRIGDTLPQTRPQRHPNEGLGGAWDVEQPELPGLSAAPSTIAEHLAGIYRAWQEAVDEAGGTVWLAASMEKSHPGVSLRVRHALDSKGEVQKSTLDMLAHVGPDAKARMVFLAGLCELWGCEPPQLKRIVTDAEIGRATVEELEEAGKIGEALKQRIAKRLGCDVGAIRR